jgi:hypothetical protein
VGETATPKMGDIYAAVGETVTSDMGDTYAVETLAVMGDGPLGAYVRIPMKPAGDSDLKAATHSDLKAATVPI